MNHTRTIGLLAALALGAIAATAQAMGHALQPEHALGVLMLANGPVGVEVKQLVEGIEKAFAAFKTTNDERLAKIEKGLPTGDIEAKLAAVQGDLAKALDLKKDLEALESKQNLQGLMGGATQGNPDKAAYKSAFYGNFVRKGQETAELKALEAKAINITTPGDGGYAVPELIDPMLEKLARDISPMRQLANIVTVGTSDYKKLVNANGIASGWVGEADARPETGTSVLKEVPAFMGELYANPKATQQALDDIFYDVERDLNMQIVEEFAVAEGAAFYTGNGTNKPKGFLAYTSVATADASRAFGSLEYIPTGVAGDFAASNKADVLFDAVKALKAAYRNGAKWTMGKSIMFEVMKLKDTTGQYLWQPKLTDSGLGMTLLGFEVVEAEDMPVKAANSLSIAFGNFKRGYTIVDRMGMRMLRDPFSAKPYVSFYTTKRVGGMVVNSEAIKLIKFAAS
jgi:HK97 family phage major capsid protein